MNQNLKDLQMFQNFLQADPNVSADFKAAVVEVPSDYETKEIDWKSVEVDGVDPKDAPDFCDAYFAYGCYTDGTEISEDDLIQMCTDYQDTLAEMAYESLY